MVKNLGTEEEILTVSGNGWGTPQIQISSRDPLAGAPKCRFSTPIQTSYRYTPHPHRSPPPRSPRRLRIIVPAPSLSHRTIYHLRAPPPYARAIATASCSWRIQRSLCDLRVFGPGAITVTDGGKSVGRAGGCGMEGGGCGAVGRRGGGGTALVGAGRAAAGATTALLTAGTAGAAGA